jgi:hypothetical protein
MRCLLGMRDFLTFRPKEVLENKKTFFECQDESSPTGASLLVTLEATHSGIINGNQRFYRPDRMQASVHTWVQDGRPAKPVLVRHDPGSDPLGRILKASYIDLSYKYASDFPIVKDTVFYNTDARKRFNLYDSIDWIVKNLMGMQDYRGLGYCELGARITQPEAVRKVLNDEYLTVSVGFTTDQGLCSICHTDWAVDDRCEHQMGSTVDGKRAFLISGNFDYQEMSFVNFPADPFAGTINKSQLEDSLNRMFFLGLPLQQQATMLSMTDSLSGMDGLYESDIQLMAEDEIPCNEDGVMAEAKTVKAELPGVQVPVIPAAAAPETKLDLNKILDEVNSPELQPERAFALKTELQAFQPENTKDTKLHKRVVSTLTAQIRKNGWEDKKDALTAEQVAAKIAILPDVLADMSVEARPNYIAQIAAEAKAVGLEFVTPSLDNLEPVAEWTPDQLPEEDRGYFADPEKLYADLVAEMAVESPDAKLSAAARKKLKKSAFCGPNKSFPVADCAHVTAARRLIGRAKVSDATKEKILACVSRKEKSLGCAGKKDEQVPVPAAAPVIEPPVLETSLLDELRAKGLLDAADAVGTDGLSALNALDKAYKGLKDEEKDRLRWATSALLEYWSAGSSLEYWKNRLAEGDKDHVLLPAAEHDSLRGALTKVEEDLAKARKSTDTWEKTSSSLVKSLKRSEATQLVIFRVLNGVKGYQGLTTDQLIAEIDRLALRTRESLEDSLEDVMIQLDGFQAPVGEKPAEAALEVGDNVTLTDPPAPKVPVSDSTKVRRSAAERAAILMNPNAKQAIETYESLKAKTAKKE